MKVTILGSGTSTGVPEWQCNCATCQDARTPGSKNYRMRPSIHVEKDGRHLLFDVTPNFVDQVDRCGITRIDAVVYTHSHNDHLAGTNDLVLPCRKQKMDMPVYALPDTLAILQRNFDYMFTKETFQGGGVGHLVPHVIDGPFELLGFELTPIPVEHSVLPVLGFRIDDFGYVPDLKRMPDESNALLRGVKALVIDGLSFNSNHPTHHSIRQAIEIINELAPREAWFTHISHRLDHRHFRQQCEENNLELPANVYLAHDGQVIEL